MIPRIAIAACVPTAAAAAQDRVTVEAISIKPVQQPEMNLNATTGQPGLFVGTFNVRYLIQFAYDSPERPIRSVVGGPDWVDRSFFAINARQRPQARYAPYVTAPA